MSGERIKWRRGLVLPRRDGLYVTAAEENGRRYWSLTVGNALGWPYTHEFCTAEEGLEHPVEPA